MPIVNVSLQVLPRVPDAELYPTVDRVIAYIAGQGIRYEVGPMETTMEGEYDQLMAIVKRCQEICIEAGASRVMSVIKIDYRPEGVTIDEKIHQYR